MEVIGEIMAKALPNASPIVNSVGVVGNTVETAAIATSDANTEKKGNTQDPLQEQIPEVSSTKISKEVKKGNPSDSTVVSEIDKTFRLSIDKNSKPKFDTALKIFLMQMLKN